MVSVALSLVGVAVLSLLLLSTTLHSGSTSDTSVSNAPGVGLADNLAAQQSLSTSLSSVDAAASGAGGYGSIDVGALSAANPSITYVAGPTTDASTVSVAVRSGGGGQVGTTVPQGGAVGAAISGADAAGGSVADSGGATAGGSVTLAARSSNGTCWLVWQGNGSATWYGAQTGLASCTAPALASAPTPGLVSSSAYPGGNREPSRRPERTGREGVAGPGDLSSSRSRGPQPRRTARRACRCSPHREVRIDLRPIAGSGRSASSPHSPNREQQAHPFTCRTGSDERVDVSRVGGSYQSEATESSVRGGMGPSRHRDVQRLVEE